VGRGGHEPPDLVPPSGREEDMSIFDPVERIARTLAKADGYDADHVRFPDPEMVLGGMFSVMSG
jgi:hypothetical protein